MTTELSKTCEKCGGAYSWGEDHRCEGEGVWVWITSKQQDNYARRLFRANIREHGSSSAEAAIRRRVPVAEIRDDRLLVPEDWHEMMKSAR